MKLTSIRHICGRVVRPLLIAMATFCAISCDSLIYDDLDPCDEGLRLRFIYDYNMEFANAFPSQVDCLTLLVYDNDGRYLMTRTVTDADLLGDEDWRMTIDLPAGRYKLIAYGGMAHSNASFAFEPQPGENIPMTDVEVYLKPECLTSPVGSRLHDLFYGALEVTVSDRNGGYAEATVPMMKDTNNLRIVLQHVDGSPVDNEEFTYTVTSTNTLFDWDNNLMPVATTTFYPWVQGQVVAGEEAVDDELVEAAYAEFSLSRFMATGGPRLIIVNNSNNREVLNIPLVSYLLMLKSDRFSYMPSQEFLDRESRWSMVFFLDNNVWAKASIIVNGWIVRINDIIE